MSGHVLPLLRIPERGGLDAVRNPLARQHPVFDGSGSPCNLRILGIGYASKGWQKGSVLVPVRTDTGQAMGYWAIPEGTTVREIALAGRVSWCEW